MVEESKADRLRHAFAAYRSGEVRLTGEGLESCTHLVSSRRGLFGVGEMGVVRTLALGYFFGLTVRNGDLYAFEACDQPHSLTRQGRIVRLVRQGDRIARAEVLARGLDNGCHQIDFLGDRLHVIDTYNQKIVRFSPDFRTREELTPLPVCASGRWSPEDPEYRHINTLLSVGDQVLLLLHNGADHTGRRSEVMICDREFRELGRRMLEGTGCHNFGLLENGTLLVCGSMAGELISPQGLHIPVSREMTRGLAVGAETIAVGTSGIVRREDREQATGSLVFLDRAYRVQAEVALPAGVTEVRRLDGQDASLSQFIAETGRTLGLGGVYA